MIDYKGGKIVWDASYNWEKDSSFYDFEQDILQVEYGNVVINVGSYSDIHNTSNPHFVIMVVDFSPYPTDEGREDAWSNPYAVIPCPSKEDLLIQLQRAIDTYPQMIG